MAKSSHAYYSAVTHVKLNTAMIIHSFIIFLLVYSFLMVGFIYFFYPIDAKMISLYFISAYHELDINFNNAMVNCENGVRYFGKIYLKVFLINSYLWIFYPVILYSIKRLKDTSNFIRGIELEDVNTIVKKIGEDPTRIPIGKTLKMPIANEVRGTFVGGRPGVGKTNFFNQAISAVREEKALIYDTKMDYIAKFFDEDRDLIANPFDQRCIRWTVLNEAKSIMDLMALAKSIIPEAPPKSQAIWYDAPRDILYGIFLYCYVNNKKSNANVWQVLNYEHKKLLNTLKFIPGAEAAVAALQTPKETLGGILLQLMTFAKIFEYLQFIDGEFSIRVWVESDEKNFLFLPNYADAKVALAPFFSLVVQTVGRAILSLHDDINRRIYIWLDEFGTIQKMDMLIDLLTQSRSKGGAIFLGTQEIVRLDNIYGKELREAMLNACGNSLTFAMEDKTDTDLFSQKLGQVEVWEQQENISLGESNDRVNVNQQRKIHQVVLPTEIMQLKDLTGYLKLSNYGLTFVEFNYLKLPDIAKTMIMNDYYLLESRRKKTLQELKADNLNTDDDSNFSAHEGENAYNEDHGEVEESEADNDCSDGIDEVSYRTIPEKSKKSIIGDV